MTPQRRGHCWQSLLSPLFCSICILLLVCTSRHLPSLEAPWRILPIDLRRAREDAAGPCCLQLLFAPLDCAREQHRRHVCHVKTCQKMCDILTLHSTHSQTHPVSLLNPFGFSVHPLPPSTEHLFSRVSRRRAELCATIY